MPLTSPSPWQRLAGHALDILLPPLCLSCDGPVSAQQTLCPACWGQIHFIADPFCAGCGVPFETPVGSGMLCGSCLTEPPLFKAARAAMLYNDASRKIIISFKHSDRIHPARALASWMHRAGQEFWAEADFIAPVPLHRGRLFSRRYNQAALLARHVAGLMDKPIFVDALQRTRATPIQGHLKRKERQENVRKAFALNPRYTAKIRGKTAILVDDVLTTGATVNECSRVLLDAGAEAVCVLTLARVRAAV
jgi:ComF family protein